MYMYTFTFFYDEKVTDVFSCNMKACPLAMWRKKKKTTEEQGRSDKLLKPSFNHLNLMTCCYINIKNLQHKVNPAKEIYIHICPHTNKVSHKRNILSFVQNENHKKQSEARAPHGAWQTFSYHLLLGGEKQINDGIMKRQKPDEKQPGTPMSNASLQVRQSCAQDHTTTGLCKLLTEREGERESRTKKNKKKSVHISVSMCVCVFVCIWVWARLQLRGEAIAIPTDLKTSLPATSKYRGMEEKKKKEREREGECQWARRRWKYRRARF